MYCGSLVAEWPDDENPVNSSRDSYIVPATRCDNHAVRNHRSGDSKSAESYGPKLAAAGTEATVMAEFRGPHGAVRQRFPVSEQWNDLPAERALARRKVDTTPLPDSNSAARQ